jgi:hypothetical protein
VTAAQRAQLAQNTQNGVDFVTLFYFGYDFGQQGDDVRGCDFLQGGTGRPASIFLPLSSSDRAPAGGERAEK